MWITARVLLGSVWYTINMLTPRQKQIKDFVEKIISKKEVAPSEREVARKFKISPSTAHEHLSKLTEKGYLDKIKNQPRGIEISKSEKLIKIPLLGIIAAGQPIEAIQSKETIRRYTKIQKNRKKNNVRI